MGETSSTKLIVLGLPWAANEDQLWSYFSQFGNVNGVEIIREKPSGKSRGFGFVDFNEASSAEAALKPSHTIGGRHCDVKFAVPKGGRPFMKMRRIFVARIPLHVTEKEFHEYFGQFGKMEDGYMPKDHTHQSFRGIGFVTYADPSAVGKVMAVKHRLGDADIVVDCATPKDVQAQESGPDTSQSQTHDKSEDHHCPTPTANVNEYGHQQGALFREVPSTQLTAEYPPVQITQFENQQRLFQILREQREYIATNQDQGDALKISHRPVCLSAVSLPSNLLPVSTVEQASPDLSTVMSSFSQGFNVLNHSLHGLPLYSRAQVDPEQSVSHELETGAGLSHSDIAPIPIGAIPPGGQHVTHRRPQSVLSITSSQSGDPAKVIEVRNGPRLFVGKLPKGTNQQDLRNHFSKFGYVMDVFIPRAKDNKKEHRGFGFVTYETEAAIQRVVAHGSHRIRDTVVAVDVAVPEEPGIVSHDQHHHFRLPSRTDQAVRIGCTQGLRNSQSGNLSQLQTGPYGPR